MLTRSTILGLAAVLPWVTLVPIPCAQAAAPAVWAGLEAGPHAVGFQLIRDTDAGRAFGGLAGAVSPSGVPGRPMRVYVWYPAAPGATAPLKVRDYVRMAADDFDLIPAGADPTDADPPLPVPLARGLEAPVRTRLFDQPAAAVKDAPPGAGPFPLLLIGQGLYYESPLTHFVLAEYLASHGYVVATCPLLGTHSRLVNLSVVDLETEVRDLEFTLACARRLACVDQERLGVIGYDLGGMAGLLLCMRNPDVDAFASFDSGILTPHFSGLPGTHPDYDEKHFGIPWLHAIQARFVPADRARESGGTLFDRKTYGDSYLLLPDTDNHGDFTAYAAFGIASAVPGYWGPVTRDRPAVLHAVAGGCRLFCDAYVRRVAAARTAMDDDAALRVGGAIARVERKPGRPMPPRPDALVQLLIERGVAGARPTIAELRAAHADSVLFDESVLNWLGYHFLLWWGREADAVAVLELNAEVFPASANAHDSLGEAYAATGEREKAIASYRRSLELNPENAHAARALETLTGEQPER